MSYHSVYFSFDFHLKWQFLFSHFFQIISYSDGVWYSWPHYLVKVIVQSLKVILHYFWTAFAFIILVYRLLMCNFYSNFTLQDYIEPLAKLAFINDDMLLLYSLYFQIHHHLADKIMTPVTIDILEELETHMIFIQVVQIIIGSSPTFSHKCICNLMFQRLIYERILFFINETVEEEWKIGIVLFAVGETRSFWLYW